MTKLLARQAFFGDSVLLHSTVTGKAGGTPLDEHKLEMLQTVIRTKVYPEMTIENFRDIIWPHCKNALADLCKRLRRKSKNTSTQ